MRNLFLLAGILLLFASEVLKTFFVLPFDFSQQFHATQIIYFSYHNIVWLRIIGLLLVAYPAWYVFRSKKIWSKISLAACLVLYVSLHLFSNKYLQASRKYQPMLTKKFSLRKGNKIATDKQVVGVLINGKAKAYPLQIIGYHHYVIDTIGNVPIVVTYCTICRSARVFSSIVNGYPDKFNLIGLIESNMVLEDSITRSWWQQATGMAIAGPMKNKFLQELPSQQSSLYAWLRQYPGSEILQPDAIYAQEYDLLSSYDQSAFKGGIMQTDSTTYAAKSLVVGIVVKKKARSYNWNKLSFVKVLEDSVSGMPILLTVENDNNSFHVWKRNIKDETLQFQEANTGEIKDLNTSSFWNTDGKCIEGKLKGAQLQEIQAYQETKQSWETFHPGSKEVDIPVY